MDRQLTSRSSLETLRKEAKRWLRSLRENDAEAKARLRRANPDAPDDPGIRDVQHAMLVEARSGAPPVRGKGALLPPNWFVQQ
jgi:hypothetical protein